MNKPLGLIAGEGLLPLLVARGARAAGRRVICVALTGNASPALRDEVDSFAWASAARVSRCIRLLKKADCQEAIVVGRVQKATLYQRGFLFRNLPDLRTLRVLFGALRHDKRPYTMLRALIKELSSEGIELIDSTKYIPEHMATRGVMTQRQPTEAQWTDIRFGWDVCSQISRMDIGQAIALYNKDVIAVEALEGTNAMIERAGQLCKRGGWTLIKVSNTQQDMRVDVPTVGTTTIEKLREANASCLVLESDKTLILEKPKVLELADRYKIAVVGWNSELQHAHAD